MKLGAVVSPIVLFIASQIIAAPEDSAANYELKRISLPGAGGAVALDYFAYDHATGKLWVPASNTGSVDVIDEKTDAVSQITGFLTGEIERRGRKITVGPTAASIGDGVVYIGDRGDATVCVIDAKTHTRRECVPLSTDHSVTTDGVVNLDVAHDGKVLDSIQDGAGLDNIDYLTEKKILYAAAGQAATLTIAEVGDDGKFHLKATVPTVKGARSVVATGNETAYVIDPAEGKILKVSPK